MPETYALGLLGGFSVRRSHSPCPVANGSRRLLAYVALHGPCERREVAGLLWPETSEDQAQASLRTRLWRVNKELPGLLTSEEHVVGLSPFVTVDSREQEALAMSLLVAPPSDVVWSRDRVQPIWAGDLLPGWYDDWVVNERERLHQLRLHALEQAAQIFLRQSELDLALALALESVRAEPLRESANAVLISVHLAEGNVVDAVRRYEWFREQLLRELRIDPSPAITQLLPAGTARRSS